MGDIHHLGTSSDSQARLLEKWITEIIAQHPDAVVAKRWSQMARETARKFPGPPTPTQSQIDLSQLDSLSDVEKEQVFAEVGRFMQGYFNDVRQQLMEVHGELLSLQKTVAELEQSNQHTEHH